VAGPRSEEKEAHILVYQVDWTTQFKEGRYVQSKQKQIQRAIPFDSDLLDDDETALAADSLFALLDEEENDSASRWGLAVRPGNGGERGVAAKVNKVGRSVAEKVYWWVEVWRVQLSSQETTLLDAFRRLPPDAANELAALAQRLAALPPNTRIDWSDSWSEEDLRDFTAHSLKRFEVEEEQHWSRAMWLSVFCPAL
jgi:hypothetical protein